MKIGLISLWFQRGQGYITKTLMQALDEHELFVFARTGAVFGTHVMEYSENWNVDNITRYHTYKVYPQDFVDWVNDNNLDMVIFNEEYDWELVEETKNKTNAKIITYLDFYKEDWKDKMKLYDEVWCSTKRSYNLVKDICNAKFISWGVDTNLFKPEPEIFSNVKRSYVDSKGIFFPPSNKFTFFHNAGWLGNNYRKNTPMVIHGFDEASKKRNDITMFVHAQVGLEKLPKETVDIIHNNKQLMYYIGNVDHPGLYHRGKILIFISKLEGLGLPLLEGMACGLPVIATDAPPMNEFVTDDVHGRLIPVVEQLKRYDDIYFPEEIVDYNKFVNQLINFEEIIDYGRNARIHTLDNFSMELFKKTIKELL